MLALVGGDWRHDHGLCRPGLALLLAACAAILGAIAFFISASPRISGGMISIVAIVIAIFGIGLSVVGVIGSAIF